MIRGAHGTTFEAIALGVEDVTGVAAVAELHQPPESVNSFGKAECSQERLVEASRNRQVVHGDGHIVDLLDRLGDVRSEGSRYATAVVRAGCAW